MKLMMTMTVNGKRMEVYGERKSQDTPVTAKVGNTKHEFENVLKFWQFVIPMRVQNIQQYK